MVKSISLIKRLADQPYFRSLKADRLAVLASLAVSRTYAAQETIFCQGDPASGLAIVERGTVKVYRLNQDGREYILRIAGPGESFNDIPALDALPNAASAMALSPTTLWMIPGAAVVHELHLDWDMALDVIHLLTDRVRELVQQVEDLALCSVTARLARFLLKQADDPALNAPGITRTTIAAHLATTPESISRALRTLEDIGAITADRQAVIVVRKDLLRAVAED